MKPKYEITTWDTDLQKYTPQKGVRKGPYTLFGLRKAIRKLRSMGYCCSYSSRHGGWCDPAVSIWRTT